MGYQALYRRYRPARFEDFVGQEAVIKTLRSQVMSGRIAHAYLDACDAPESALHLTLNKLLSQVPSALRAKITLMHLNRDFAAFVKAQGFGCATDLLYKGE